MIIFSLLYVLLLLVPTHGFPSSRQDVSFKDVINKHIEGNRQKLSDFINGLLAWKKSVETAEDLDKQLKLLTLGKRSFSSIRIRDGGIFGHSNLLFVRYS